MGIIGYEYILRLYWIMETRWKLQGLYRVYIGISLRRTPHPVIVV